MKTFIVVKLQINGTHNWPNCSMIGVEYLKYCHRHTFHIVCRIQTMQARDCEFIITKRDIRRIIERCFSSNAHTNEMLFRNKSCEEIASVIGDKLKEECYDIKEVRVGEDDEFYGVVQYD